VKDRVLFGFCFPVIALSAWLAFFNALGGYKVAAKKSIVLIVAFSALYLLGLIAFDLETLSHSEGADSFEAVWVAIMNNICCDDRPDAELDSEAGRSSRKQMMHEGVAIIVCRMHSHKFAVYWL
jgi:hypothetical protein